MTLQQRMQDFKPNILCQIDLRGRDSKPQTIQEYGQLRDVMIQREWSSVDDEFFIENVTRRGCTFYGCLFNGHDLLTEANGHQKECWRMQTLVGLDFDKCSISPEVMVEHFINEGYEPWLAYCTFSDGVTEGRSYRLLWKVEANLNMTYEQVGKAIKSFATFAGGFADKHSMDPSRLWQGSDKGTVYYSSTAAKLDLSKGFLSCSSH